LLKLKFPARPWSKITLAYLVGPYVDHQPKGFLQTHQSNGRRFFFEGSNPPGLNKDYDGKVMSLADEILQNRFQYFFYKNHDLGPGPDWFLNPVTGKRGKAQLHWCDIDLFDPDVGDIKFIWEPSRFAWVYTLVRAYAASGDEKYAEKFWSLFESWLEANQPNTGPNYACGQECAIRLMAMCFAFYGLDNSKASTVERKIKLVIAIAVHADRIEKNIDFAISTRTNHSLTEAVGLYTVGTLFPELKGSERWLKTGKKVLTSEGLKQIYSDGSYSQHSMNYHRLMLQDFLWALRLGELNGDLFCDELVFGCKKAVNFLYQMQDGTAGHVPNYGPNDGALLVPLNSCDYLDYRPVLQAANYLFNKERIYETGPWDEDLLWFFGQEALTASIKPPSRKDTMYKRGGYYTFRNNESWAMMRCHSYSDRPGHADMLHLDLWWKGYNILRDSGTYMYNCGEPWQSYFSSTSAHNAITVDKVDQMTRALRFMWFDWTKAKLAMHKSLESVKIMQGEHYGYCRKGENIIHRRAVLSWEDICWLIVDDVLGTGTHQVGLYWQLCDCDYELKGNTLTLQTEQGQVCLVMLDSAGDGRCECFTGDDGPIGWQSLYYGSREPAPTLVRSEKVDLPVRFVTLVSLGDSIKDVALSKANVVFWVPERSGQKHIVALNPIKSSDRNAFVFVQQDSEKLFLD